MSPDLQKLNSFQIWEVSSHHWKRNLIENLSVKFFSLTTVIVKLNKKTFKVSCCRLGTTKNDVTNSWRIKKIFWKTGFDISLLPGNALTSDVFLIALRLRLFFLNWWKITFLKFTRIHISKLAFLQYLLRKTVKWWNTKTKVWGCFQLAFYLFLSSQQGWLLTSKISSTF